MSAPSVPKNFSTVLFTICTIYWLGIDDNEFLSRRSCCGEGNRYSKTLYVIGNKLLNSLAILSPIINLSKLANSLLSLQSSFNFFAFVSSVYPLLHAFFALAVIFFILAISFNAISFACLDSIVLSST